MTNRRLSLLPLLLGVILGSLAGHSALAAQDDLEALCPLLLEERQNDVDELELAIQLDETELEVAEEIFSFQDGLWKEDMTQRLRYLAAKHHLDLARATLERSKRRLERQQAVVEQYRLVCDPASADGSAEERRRAIEEAHRRYLAADCRVRALDVAVVEVNVGHHEENLRSATNLRRDDIASREQVLYAERDVELMVKELEHARQRAVGCPPVD